MDEGDLARVPASSEASEAPGKGRQGGFWEGGSEARGGWGNASSSEPLLPRPPDRDTGEEPSSYVPQHRQENTRAEDVQLSGPKYSF